MKTDTDKATARPWRVSDASGSEIFSGRDYIVHTVQLPPGRVDEEIANAALIVQAVNEHAALCAVAEAARKMINAPTETITTSEHHPLIHPIRSALANLAAVREGKAVQS